MRAVMYHYVRPTVRGLPHFRYLHLEDFREQLAFFKAQFGVLMPEAFLEMLAQRKMPDRGIVLTFDDGLKEHIDCAASELERAGLRGFFFVNTAPFSRGEALDVHRIHHLIGEFGGETVLEALQQSQILADKLKPADDAFAATTYQHQTNSAATTQVKRILNYATDRQGRAEALRTLERRLGADVSWKKDFYLTIGDVRSLRMRGHYVGSHGVSHQVLSALSREEQQAELAQSHSDLEMDSLAQDWRLFCYPYGGPSTFTAQTVEELMQAGYSAAFCVAPGDILSSSDPYRLARFDCNMFPFGAASLGPERAAGRNLQE